MIAAGLLCAAFAQAQDAFRDGIERIYQEGRYERVLPLNRRDAARQERRPQRPARDAGEPEMIDRARQQRVEPPPAPPPEGPGVIARILSVLPWIALGIVVLLVLGNALRWKRARKAPPVRRPGDGPVGETVPDAPHAGMTAAEALAREGRYAEAIHALLLAAIESLRASRSLAASLTSRELVRKAGLSDAGRAALLHLVQAVEVTLFGGQPAGAEDYRACAAEMGRIGT